MAALTQAPGQSSGPPSWVIAENSLPPGVVASHSGAPPVSLLSGTAEPPTNLLAQLSSILINGPLSDASGTLTGATGLPPSLSLPSGVTGPPPGITLPPDVTGPPASISIPTGATGPPPGFSIPSGVTGLPAGMTSLPSSLAGSGSNSLPTKASSHFLTYQQSHTLIGVTCMLLVLCLAAVGGRLMARRVSRMRLEADDWICVAALVMFIGLCIEQFLLAHYGMLILSQLPPRESVLHVFGKSEFASQITYAFVTCAAKASLLMLYRRLFSLRVKWFRIAWWTNIGLVAALFLALVMLDCTQCKPLSTIWDSPGSCIPNQTKSSSTGFINAVIDSAILLLPLRMVWSLQMSYKQKVAICGVFGLGLIGVAISLARAISIANPDLFKSGGLAFILWSTTEPAVGLICSCLPVLRPLYITGLTKLGSSRGWKWYASKTSRSYGYSAGSSGRDKDKSHLTGNTLRSALTFKNKKDKTWFTAMESEMGGPYEEMKASPISPLDKPLPPAYTPRQEEDTGYHTWSWNLLSRPRNENTAPKLTRSPTARDSAPPVTTRTSSRAGNNSILASGASFKGKVFSSRLKTHTPILDRDQQSSTQSDRWRSPPLTVESSPSKWRSPTQSPKSEADSWTSPSLVPTRRVSTRGALQEPISESTNDAFALPSRPRATARVESSERTSPPKLRIRTQDNILPTPALPPKFGSGDSYPGWSHGTRDGAVSRAVAEGSPRPRSNSGGTMWPSTEPDITRKEVEAAILRGHAT